MKMIMKIQNILSLVLIMSFIISCNEDQYEIPKDDEGNVILTKPSETETEGLSTLDDEFTVTAKFYNSNSGDQMEVELLQLQTSEEYNTDSKLLLPIEGSQKEVTLNDNLEATVTYSRDEANLEQVGEYVTVVFEGETDYAKTRVYLENATDVTDPMVGGTVITPIMAKEDTAYFNIIVEPIQEEYEGEIVVKSKSSSSDDWSEIQESPLTGDQPYLAPISGDEYEANDTLYYQFIAEKGGYKDVVEKQMVISQPYFFASKTATISPSDALNLFTNSVEDTADVEIGAEETSAIVSLTSVDGLLKLQGNSDWLAASNDNSIEFVPSTQEMYQNNNSTAAIEAFENAASGDVTTTADPLYEEGVYIFKVENGTTPEDTYYGMVKFINSSTELVEFEYRIGDQYSHVPIVL